MGQASWLYRDHCTHVPSEVHPRSTENLFSITATLSTGKKCNLMMQKTFNLHNQMKPCWLVTDEHCIYKWLEINSNSLLLQVLLKTFKIINFRKISDRCLEKPLKLIGAICEKIVQLQDKIPHKLPCFDHYLSLFSSEPNLSLLFSLISILFQFSTQTFSCLKKFSDKYVKSANSLKYTLTNCVFYFLICIMVLIYEGYSIK